LTTTPSLEDQARIFAADISDLLNGTVTGGIRLTAVVTPERGTIVGRGITKRQWQVQSIPLTLNAKAARAWLRVGYVLQLDPERVHLTVAKSDYSLYLDEPCDEMVLHYDYDREPTNEYPAAHFQVSGTASALAELCERTGQQGKDLKDFHFPVGGRRYRPTLEEVIEFLVIEGFADARDGWTDIVAAHRADWEDRQLCAAVRRNPDVAVDQLREDGFL